MDPLPNPYQMTSSSTCTGRIEENLENRGEKRVMSEVLQGIQKTVDFGMNIEDRRCIMAVSESHITWRVKIIYDWLFETSSKLNSSLMPPFFSPHITEVVKDDRPISPTGFC